MPAPGVLFLLAPGMLTVQGAVAMETCAWSDPDADWTKGAGWPCGHAELTDGDVEAGLAAAGVATGENPDPPRLSPSAATK